MTPNEAIDIMKALALIGKTMGLSVQQVASTVALLNPKGHKKLVEASKLYREFCEANLVKRGEMLGIKITEFKKRKGEG